MKIAFVCNELPPAPAGGIGPCVATTAAGLAAAGHQVSVVGCYDRDYRWSIPGVRVIPIIMGGSLGQRVMRLLRGARIRLVLQRLARDSGLDIVEWPDFQGLYVKRVPGVTDVLRTHGTSTSHSMQGLARTHWLTRRMELRTLRSVPNWIGTSRWFMDEWERLSHACPVRKTVVYNPVDCQLFRPGDPRDRDPDLVLFVGRLWERKGAFALAMAARTFLAEPPRARLLYVGADPDGRSRKKIRELVGPRLSDRVSFLDPVPQDEVAVLMRRCAVFAMPSILESFGNVWAEAMASGTPVLGSILSCGPEVVPDGEAGVLADPRDIGSIAEQVVSLMTDRSLRARLGSRGREIALERYSLEVGIARTLDFYRKCLC